MQRVAYWLIGLGALALIGWSVKGFFLADAIPVFVRVAVGAIAAGAIILLVMVLVDRVRKGDEFEEVER
jgi:hypothetical protein